MTPPKRARIDATVATPGEKKSLSPLSAASDHIDRHTESLRDGIATLLRTRGREHVKLLHRVHTKRKNVQTPVMQPMFDITTDSIFTFVARARVQDYMKQEANSPGHCQHTQME
jgi:hypothetical protein